MPQSIIPATNFDAVVRIPYDKQINQVLRNGKLGDLNFGKVLSLLMDFYLSPINSIPKAIKKQITCN